ncbi:substrate-binding domain-containing protein [Aliiruegeria lutimaris]|uniref:Monosaccharide ABC transporter substrate-binding protein, CUT2 family n=1 Tax=Aliiruegeria lutimaris TaxID=571298 RepID=A0A1G8T4Y6_9RHOB|nr:substrate-binding domain-containing protein [Aliiruegeria lutimaris]SDJ36669.1 monosaccharide ABC transporter substrate-binding protein, CUT2 family [Aliiruegeria lutimaris]
MTKLMKTMTLAAALLSGTAALADTPKIGAAVYGLNAEFMQLWAAALEQHPAVTEGKVDVTIFDGRYDALVQQEQFETMITQGFDAIIFVPIDIEAGAEAVRLADEAGIPVFGSNTRVNSDKLKAYVGSDDVQSGYMEAKYVLDKIGCTGNVVVIEGPIGQSAQIQRLEGNQKALAECPDVKVVEQQTANWSRAEAQTLMENWLTAHPGDIAGVIGQNDEMALGAIEAIKAAGLNVNDFAIAGIDGVTDALNAVKADEMASILQDGFAQAQGALDLAIKAVDPSYEPMSAIWEQYPDMPWNDGADAEYNVPWTPVTLENVDALLEMRQ